MCVRLAPVCIAPETDLGVKDLGAGHLGGDPRETEAGDGDSQAGVCWECLSTGALSLPFPGACTCASSLPPQSEAAHGAREGTMARGPLKAEAVLAAGGGAVQR